MTHLKDKLIGIGKIKNGDVIEIFQSEKITESIAYSFFLKVFADVIEDGLALQFTNMNPSQYSAIYAVLDKTILGIMTYHIIIEKKTTIIKLSSVEKKHRNQGIYSILFQSLEKISIEKEVSHIISWIHKKNTVSLISAEKTGRFPEYVVMGKRIS